MEPYTAHLNVIDADLVDGEGLQIGENALDFLIIAEFLDMNTTDGSFISAICQVYENDGADFWKVLYKLEKWF